MVKFAAATVVLLALACGWTSGAKPNYTYHVSVADPVEANYQEKAESRYLENAKGFYSVLEPNGALRTVTYTADEHGFRPVITYSYGHAVAPVKTVVKPVVPAQVVKVASQPAPQPIVVRIPHQPAVVPVRKVIQQQVLVSPVPVQAVPVQRIVKPVVVSSEVSGGGYSYPKPTTTTTTTTTEAPSGGYSYPKPSGGYSYPKPQNEYLPPVQAVKVPVVTKVQGLALPAVSVAAPVKLATAVYQQIAQPAPVYHQYHQQIFQQQQPIYAPAPVKVAVAPQPAAAVYQFQTRAPAQVQYYQPAQAKVPVQTFQYQPQYIQQAPPQVVYQQPQQQYFQQPQQYVQKVQQVRAPAVVQSYIHRQPAQVVTYAPQHVATYTPMQVVNQVTYAQPQVVLSQLPQKQVTFATPNAVLQKPAVQLASAVQVAPRPSSNVHISGNAFAVPAASGAKNPLTFLYSYGDGTSSVSHSYSGSGW